MSIAQKPRVLVVGYDAKTRALMHAELTKAGLIFLVSSGLADARGMFKSNAKIDVVLTVEKYKDGDVGKLIQEMKDMDILSGVPVVVYSDNVPAATALLDGFMPTAPEGFSRPEVFQKPGDFTAAISAITRAMGVPVRSAGATTPNSKKRVRSHSW